MQIKSRHNVSLGFGMSSMTDIVFLLLIFFVVVSTLVSPFGENVSLPTSGTPSTNNSQPLKITIGPDLSYYRNQRKTSFASIENELKRRKDEPDKPKILLKVNNAIPTGEMVQFLSVAKENQFEVVLAGRAQ